MIVPPGFASKACALPGCPTPVIGRDAYDLSRKKYCSQAHGVAHRKLRGWKPVRPPRSSSVRGGRKGGKRSGEARRALAVSRAVEDVLSSVAGELLELVPMKQRYLLTGALAEAYHIGYRACSRNIHRRIKNGEQPGAAVRGVHHDHASGQRRAADA